MKVYKEADLRHNALANARAAILGYGNQGHAHALNLRDSGVDVVIGARREGAGWDRAREDGFEPLQLAEAVETADFVVLLTPDEIQGQMFEAVIRRNLRPGAALVFAHGYAIAFGDIVASPDSDVILVAPKGQGHFLRRMYRHKHGVMCLVGVENDASGQAWERALSYAHALGCLRAGAIATTFREEAVTDLFGEQVVLCGGVPALVKAAFETLVEAGIDPHVAYIECLHELKIIADLMYRRGIHDMRRRISRTAAWGSFEAESTFVDGSMREKMRETLERIESGAFARGWKAETQEDQKHLLSLIESESQHAIERAGEAVRALMPYLKEEGS